MPDDDGDVVQGNAFVSDVGSYKKRKIGTNMTVAFLPDDGDVVQVNTVASDVGNYEKRKIGTNRIVASVPGDGDVVQSNTVVPKVGSYKRTFWSNMIDEVVEENTERS